jgi:hypothetical protein
VESTRYDSGGRPGWEQSPVLTLGRVG